MNNDKLKQMILDFKEIRNAIYDVDNGRNPYDRDVRLLRAQRVAHDITEKYKKELKDLERDG